MRGSFLFISKGRIELHGFFWKFAVIRFSANSEYRISTDGWLWCEDDRNDEDDSDDDNDDDDIEWNDDDDNDSYKYDTNK